MLKNCLISDMRHCAMLLKKNLVYLEISYHSKYYRAFIVLTQNEIILVCCILHNYLMGVNLNESLITKVDEKVLYSRHERAALTPREDDKDARQ